MPTIIYRDRLTGKEEREKVYGSSILKLLYGDSYESYFVGKPFLYLLAKYPLFSALIGLWQRCPLTKANIRPFIEKYHVDSSEFEKPVDAFTCFDDFFVRKLKLAARPIAPGNDVAIIPADGRYLFYPNISQAEGFAVKGKKFDLASLLQDRNLAERYAQGTMVIARLCPSDYHRFHFPCDCIPEAPQLINGWLYSVNPIAIKKNIQIFTQNKRVRCELATEAFGKVQFIAIGATAVGSIHETFTPGKPYPKGSEKGFFSFGASSLIILFEPGRIKLDNDLVALSQDYTEVRCLMGQSLGKSVT